MRIRRKPWARPELEACEYFIDNPKELKNKWRSYFKNDNPIYLELGCGKGVFISEIAFKNPNINYIAIVIKSDVLGYARRYIESKYAEEGRNVENVLLTAYNIEQILDIFGEEDKIDRIYINFCNPWPKAKHKKRRLTQTKQLNLYKQFLKPEGEIYYKTDDDELYLATIKYFEESGFTILSKTDDLKEDEDNILTEHEIMFRGKGIKIKQILAKIN